MVSIYVAQDKQYQWSRVFYPGVLPCLTCGFCPVSETLLACIIACGMRVSVHSQVRRTNGGHCPLREWLSNCIWHFSNYISLAIMLSYSHTMLQQEAWECNSWLCTWNSRAVLLKKEKRLTWRTCENTDFWTASQSFWLSRSQIRPTSSKFLVYWGC